MGCRYRKTGAAAIKQGYRAPSRRDGHNAGGTEVAAWNDERLGLRTPQKKQTYRASICRATPRTAIRDQNHKSLPMTAAVALYKGPKTTYPYETKQFEGEKNCVKVIRRKEDGASRATAMQSAHNRSFFWKYIAASTATRERSNGPRVFPEAYRRVSSAPKSSKSFFPRWAGGNVLWMETAA